MENGEHNEQAPVFECGAPTTSNETQHTRLGASAIGQALDRDVPHFLAFPEPNSDSAIDLAYQGIIAP